MILVFGSLNMDLTFPVEHLPQPGETVLAPGYRTSPGGKGNNQAVAASRAGSEVAMVGRVGRDPFAEPLLANLRKNDIDAGHVVRCDEPTGCAAIGVDRAGENAILVASGANASVSPSDVPDALTATARVILAQMEVPPAAVDAVMKHAGARVGGRPLRLLNAAPADGSTSAMLKHCDLLIVNEGEADHLAAEAGLADARSGPAQALVAGLGRHHGLRVVLTLGGEGALFGPDEEGAVLHQPAPEIEPVDTTGAGDAFCGAFAAALDQGEPWATALAWGVAAGALACGAHGAQAALPDRDAIVAAAARLPAQCRLNPE